ncbi:MAG: glycosyltransferase [Syntrophobacteraceae bacterium]
MQITVAICTYNRCSLLAQTLGQMTNLVIPSGIEWELLVVNNNSTDSTEEVIKSFSTSLPIRHVFEPRPGKSNALNAASRSARGQYILWTDDDVLVDRGWMAAYWEALERRPDAGFFGGPIEPLFEGSPPKWLKRCLPQIEEAYAIRDLGERPFLFSKKIQPYGVNWAVRRKEQLLYPYDPSLGPQPGSFIRGEEEAVITAMLDAGIEGWWVPGARVKHFTPRARQTVRYLRNYYSGSGEYDSRELSQEGLAMLFGVPRFLWRQAIIGEIKYGFRRCISDPRVWIEDLKLSARAFGSIRAHKVRRSWQ